MAQFLHAPSEHPCAITAARLTSHLSLLQVTDSGFPSGRYTLSHGLEAFAQSGQLDSPGRRSSLEALLSDSVRFAIGPSDGVALACAHRAAGAGNRIDLDGATNADERLTAVKLSREARDASTRTGRALLDTATSALGATAMLEYAELVRTGRSPGNHAVVLGMLSAWSGVARLEAVTAELFAFSASWVAAAVRLSLIDHRTAQGLLSRVRPVIVEAAMSAVDGGVTRIASCTPLIDVMSMRHEQAELRLFAS
jgi:urease accessory protein